MSRGGGMGGFNMPQFTGAVKWLILANVAVFVLQSVMYAFLPEAAQVFRYLALTPEHILGRGYLWELISYAFLHGGVMHLFFNMLTLWMFGAQMEGHFGRRQFFEFFYFCVIGSAIVFTLVSYSAVFGLSPLVHLVGASGGIFGLLIAFGMIFSEAQIYLFPFPIAVKAKYLVAMWMGIDILLMLRNEEPGSAIAHLGGAAFGYLYLKFLPRKGLGFGFSESFYGVRNRYHKWKRRQAAKKFEVYMREHDRSDYFDEHGNYRDPKKDNGDAGKGPWVN
ncbi:MAG TPA: rhomboid family intramembrane serine protease [Terriglobales bacterium]|nr:rhomboid family intramembrane serine protease [Terriglobales bacterium]